MTTVALHTPIVESRLLRDESATQALATALAAQLRRQDEASTIIELHGNLGAGKTTFVRHLLRALGVTGRIKSPTYAVVEPHEAPATTTRPRLSIWHFDFYRFNDPREWEDAGLRDLYASPGLKLAEWPEQAAGLLPVPDLEIALQAQLDESRNNEHGADERRTVTLTARTPAGDALLHGLEPKVESKP